MKRFIAGTCMLFLIVALVGAGSANDKKQGFFNSMHYAVEIEGVYLEGVTSVQGVGIETEVIEYQDGEDKILRKRPGRTRFGNIVITCAVGSDASVQMWDWYQQVLIGQVTKKSGSIVVLNRQDTEVARYNFSNAFPCKWESHNYLLKKPEDKVELAVETIQQVIPAN
ncbi:MAG: phage tail protein [Endomicrobiales bacterium]|nr:phage tail protein [Endomicrobiales bacterium]